MKRNIERCYIQFITFKHIYASNIDEKYLKSKLIAKLKKSTHRKASEEGEVLLLKKLKHKRKKLTSKQRITFAKKAKSCNKEFVSHVTSNMHKRRLS